MQLIGLIKCSLFVLLSNVNALLKLEAKSVKTLRTSFQSNPLIIGILWAMITHSIYFIYSHQDQQLSTSTARLYHLGSVCVYVCVRV